MVADPLEDLTPLLARLAESGAEIDGLARCDEVRRPIEDPRSRTPTAAASAAPRTATRDAGAPADLDVTARGSADAPTRRAL